MEGDVLELSLWFNSNKVIMQERLERTCSNAGVGIHIGHHASYFKESPDFVILEFDDGTTGQALVMKKSWNNCKHLINISIGKWARKNGLWEAKLRQRTVRCYLTVISDYRRFLVSKVKP